MIWFDILALWLGLSLIVGLILGRVLKWCDA